MEHETEMDHADFTVYHAHILLLVQYSSRSLLLPSNMALNFS